MPRMPWENVEKNSEGINRFKPEAGKTVRIRFMEREPEADFMMWVDGLGFIKTFGTVENVNGRMLITEPGLETELTGKTPGLAYVLPVAIYLDADSKGGLKKNKKSAVRYALWTFYAGVAEKLVTLASEYDDLTTVDLIVTGKAKGKYVDVSINTAKDCASNWIKGVDVEYCAMPFAGDKLGNFLGRAVTEDELREAVGKTETPDRKNAGAAAKG